MSEVFTILIKTDIEKATTLLVSNLNMLFNVLEGLNNQDTIFQATGFVSYLKNNKSIIVKYFDFLQSQDIGKIRRTAIQIFLETFRPFCDRADLNDVSLLEILQKFETGFSQQYLDSYERAFGSNQYSLAIKRLVNFILFVSNKRK